MTANGVPTDTSKFGYFHQVFYATLINKLDMIIRKSVIFDMEILFGLNVLIRVDALKMNYKKIWIKQSNLTRAGLNFKS